MSIAQFQQELSKGLPSAVYLLHSSEDFLLYEAFTSIKDHFHTVSEFNFNSYDIKSPDKDFKIEDIIDALNTLPFLSERKIIILKNSQKLSKKDSKKLSDYLVAPANSSLFIMLFEGKAPKLFDIAVQKKLKTIALNIQGNDIPSWVRYKAEKKGAKLTDKAVDYLICTVGTDLGMLYAEIEKFASWDALSINKPIDVADIRGMVYCGIEYSAFDLINALNRRDSKEVFRIFENIKTNIEPQMLLGALNWQYSSQQAQLQKKDARQFINIFRALHEADAGIKTSNNYAIEELLIKLLRN